MASITICSDFGAQKNSQPLFSLFPHLFAMKWWDRMLWSSFSECWALSQLFHSPLSLSLCQALGPKLLLKFNHHPSDMREGELALASNLCEVTGILSDGTHWPPFMFVMKMSITNISGVFQQFQSIFLLEHLQHFGPGLLARVIPSAWLLYVLPSLP